MLENESSTRFQSSDETLKRISSHSPTNRSDLPEAQPATTAPENDGPVTRKNLSRFDCLAFRDIEQPKRELERERLEYVYEESQTLRC